MVAAWRVDSPTRGDSENFRGCGVNSSANSIRWKKPLFNLSLGILDNKTESPRRPRLYDFLLNLVPNVILANCVQKFMALPCEPKYCRLARDASVIFNDCCFNQPSFLHYSDMMRRGGIVGLHQRIFEITRFNSLKDFPNSFHITFHNLERNWRTSLT